MKKLLLASTAAVLLLALPGCKEDRHEKKAPKQTKKMKTEKDKKGVKKERGMTYHDKM